MFRLSYRTEKNIHIITLLSFSQLNHRWYIPMEIIYIKKKYSTGKNYSMPTAIIGSFYWTCKIVTAVSTSASATKVIFYWALAVVWGCSLKSWGAGIVVALTRSECELVGWALWGLAELHVFLHQHKASKLLQNGFDGVASIPPWENWNCPRFHLAWWRHTVHVNPTDEPYSGWLVRVGTAALYPQAVHAILETRTRRPNDHPCPVLQIDIILVDKTPAYSPISNAFLTSL